MLTNTQEISVIKVLTDFPNYFNNFLKNYQGLIAQGNYVYSRHPELKAEYDAVLNRGSKNYNDLYRIKSVIDSFKQKGKSIVDWIKGKIGLSDSLGIAPLIIAGISAASVFGMITAIGSWLKDTSVLAKRLEFLKDQEARGLSPSEAASLAERTFGKPGATSLFGNIQNLLLIGGAIILLPYLFKMFGGKR